jgi:hypothetical protein
MNIHLTVKKLLDRIEGIHDVFLLEAENIDIAAYAAVRKRKVRNSTLAAVASVGIAALTVWMVRSKKRLKIA